MSIFDRCWSIPYIFVIGNKRFQTPILSMWPQRHDRVLLYNDADQATHVVVFGVLEDARVLQEVVDLPRDHAGLWNNTKIIYKSASVHCDFLDGYKNYIELEYDSFIV